MAWDKSIVVCATQRTGSTMVFDDILNMIGGPRKDSERLFNSIRARNADDTWSVIWPQVEDRMQCGGLLINKVMFHYIAHIASFISGEAPFRYPPVLKFVPEKFDPFYAHFRRSIWLYVERRDVVAQAVSMHFAIRTKIWERLAENSDKEPVPDIAINYEPEPMLGILKQFMEERRQWRFFFRHYNIEPMCIYYEDAVNNYPGYLNEVMQRIQMTAPDPAPMRRMLEVERKDKHRFIACLRRDAIVQGFLPPIVERL